MGFSVETGDAEAYTARRTAEQRNHDPRASGTPHGFFPQAALTVLVYWLPLNLGSERSASHVPLRNAVIVSSCVRSLSLSFSVCKLGVASAINHRVLGTLPGICMLDTHHLLLLSMPLAT